MILPFLQTGNSSGGESSIVVFLAILILVVARRMYRNYTGVRVSAGRTIGYTIFYIVFGGFFLLISFFEGVQLYYAVPEAALLLVGVYLSYKLVDARIKFWKSDRGIFYKGAVLIYLIYVIGLIARISIEFIYIGPSAFTISAVSLSQTAIFATAVTDLLLVFGIGLLIGRNVRIYQRYKLILEGKENIAATP